jgi:hypothetical protein
LVVDKVVDAPPPPPFFCILLKLKSHFRQGFLGAFPPKLLMFFRTGAKEAGLLIDRFLSKSNWPECSRASQKHIPAN